MEIYCEVTKFCCIVGLSACLVCLFAAFVAAPVLDALHRWIGKPIIQKVLSAAFVVGLVHFGSTKYAGHITYDGGIRRGTVSNIVSNDIVFIAWQRDMSGGVYVPETAAVYIDYRPIAATNEEWGLLAQAVVSDWSWNGLLADATNYDYNVWAYYIPPEPVHTNGVWVYKTLKDRSGRFPIPLRARIEVNGKAIATPKEKRKDEE